MLSRAAVLVMLASCGGADIGEACDTPGDQDECEDGAVCTNDSSANTCRKICQNDDECTGSEECNGISGTNVKSCQPKK